MNQDDMSQFISGKIKESAELKLAMDAQQIGIIAQISQKIIDGYKAGKKVLIFGGSFIVWMISYQRFIDRYYHSTLFFDHILFQHYLVKLFFPVEGL